jgi:isocitrate dehydrogenase
VVVNEKQNKRSKFVHLTKNTLQKHTLGQMKLIVKNVVESGGIGHVPSRQIRIEQYASTKHAAQTGGIGHIPSRQIRIERFAAMKHAAQISGIGHIPSR